MLDRRKKYLQVALNSTLSEAADIISRLPRSDRILVEAGTPLIKRYGIDAIRNIRSWWPGYIVADLKVMDRGETEAAIARDGGANAAIALGQAPIETINAFIDICTKLGIDSMIDMMNVEQPIKVLRKFRSMPTVVILHRGVDEELFNKDKPIPYIHINKIRSSYNTLISMAGGDTIREVQRAVFNDANIVVVWKEFYQASQETGALAEEFLKAVK